MGCLAFSLLWVTQFILSTGTVNGTRMGTPTAALKGILLGATAVQHVRENHQRAEVRFHPACEEGAAQLNSKYKRV